MQLLSFCIENILMGALLKKLINIYIPHGCFHHWDLLYENSNFFQTEYPVVNVP